MAQQSLYLFYPNGARVSPLANDGAITLSINCGVVLLCSYFTKRYSCEYCTKPFRRNCDLLHHKREVHEWILRFEYEKCKKNLKESRILRDINGPAAFAIGVMLNSSLRRRKKSCM